MEISLKGVKAKKCEFGGEKEPSAGDFMPEDDQKFHANLNDGSVE